jgi:hypothetical protein
MSYMVAMAMPFTGGNFISHINFCCLETIQTHFKEVNALKRWCMVNADFP